MCINAAIHITTPITDINNRNLAEEGQCWLFLPEPMYHGGVCLVFIYQGKFTVYNFSQNIFTLSKIRLGKLTLITLLMVPYPG